MMKNRYIPFVLLIALSAISITLESCKSDKHEKGEMPVETVTVAQPVIDSVVLRQSYPATLMATDVADVVARVNGHVLKQCYESGDYVKAGQPLFIIESTTYRNAVERCQAALESAVAQNEYAAKQYEAMKKAIEADAVSRMDVIQAESNLRQSEAAVKTARAELENARTQLGYCTVRAPFSGKASRALLSPGAYVSGEGNPVTLCSVYDDRQLFVDFSIPTNRYLEMADTRAGKMVDYDRIGVEFGDSVVGKYFGKLIYSSPDVSTSTGTVMMRLLVDNTHGELRNGMYCTVALPYAVDPKALLIKDASISTDQLGKFVYLVNDSDKVVYTPIEVGDIYDDTLRIVDKGLTPESRYVTTAILKVRDGMTVKPVAEPAASTGRQARK